MLHDVETADPPSKRPGVNRELITLAWPLILSSACWTVQITTDRVLLNYFGRDEMAASMPAVLAFWVPMNLLFHTVMYSATFVAQYIGAGRPHRAGPVVGQALFFGLMGGAAFMLASPFSEWFMSWGGHAEHLQKLEAVYFRCLCFNALPMLITGACNAFFTGRGDSRTVLLINAVGMVVNAVLAYAWIFGEFGFPRWGIAGAGWSTVAASWCSAVLGMVLLLRPRFRREYGTDRLFVIEPSLFRRLMRFGFPNGIMTAVDCLAFTVFTFVVGLFGATELAATNIAFTLNMLMFLPTLGLGQAVEVLVGRHLGEDRPDRAEQSAWAGFRWAWAFMATVSAIFVFAPQVFLWAFTGEEQDEALEMARILLRFIAVYSLFDSASLIFSFALRGAGDTRFVTMVAIGPGWIVMVIPAYLAHVYKWGLYWAWTAATAYIVLLAVIFFLRFRHGAWKSMRVIEPVVI